MENPYQSPDTLHSKPHADDAIVSTYSGMVHQVGILGILLIIHGVLLLAVAAGAISIAIIAPGVEGAGMDETTKTLVLIVYGGMGGLAVVTAIVQILAGVRLMRFQGRVLGIVAVSMGVLVWLTGVCALTGIPLLIYGLVVLLNSDVGRAFAMRKQGLSKREVVAAFSG